MTDSPPRTPTPRTVAAVCLEFTRRAQEASEEVSRVDRGDEHSDLPLAYHEAVVWGWGSAVQMALARRESSGQDPLAELELLAHTIEKSRLLLMALDRAAVPAADRAGRADALKDAELLVRQSVALLHGEAGFRDERGPHRCAACNSTDHSTFNHTPAIMSRHPRPATAPAAAAVRATQDRPPFLPAVEEDFNDWSAYPITPMPDDEDMSELYHLCLFLGGDSSSFTGELLKLIGKADPGNLNRLAQGYPRHVRAFLLWRACAPVQATTLVALLEATEMTVRRT